MTVGLDPSYTHSGVAVIDKSTKTIHFTVISSNIGKKTFSNLYAAAKVIERGVTEFLNSVTSGSFVIFTEVPPPSGSFASGLYGLDMSLIRGLEKYKMPIYGCNPTYIGHLHGTRRYHKSMSVELAKRIIDLFVASGYSVKMKGRLSNDMAEAFLFAVRAFVRFNKGQVAKDVVTFKPVFVEEKEFLLYNGK